MENNKTDTGTESTADDRGVAIGPGGEEHRVPDTHAGQEEWAAGSTDGESSDDSPGDADSDVVLSRTLAAEPALVRGTLQELAATGAWSGLADASRGRVTLHVSDEGAGASQIEVRQPVASGENADHVRAALGHALDELESRMVERTSDAS